MGWEVCYFYPKNKSSKLKILITGASGFIGKNLISFLLNNNQITVIIRNKKKIIDQPWYKKVEIIQGDIFNKNLNIFYKDYDILIHLAWSNLNDYNSFLVNKINGFIDNPDKYIPIEKTKIPDGSPIGNFSCDY